MSEDKTFKRDEINSIVEQLEAVNVNGEPVFAIHQEDGLGSVNVQVKICFGNTRWLDFTLDPSEPETEPSKRVRLSIL